MKAQVRDGMMEQKTAFASAQMMIAVAIVGLLVAIAAPYLIV